MNDSGTNLKFEYLYRDAGNYKQFGSIILSNPHGLTPEQATEKLLQNLVDEAFFDPIKVNVPLLEKYDFDPELDHGWYEFDLFSETSEAPTESVIIDDFLTRFK